MWLAEMDTEHYNFKAIGRTEAAAMRRLAAAFTLHLKSCGKDLKSWKKETQSTVEAYYGADTMELVSDGMWRDGLRLQAEDIK